MTDIVPAFDYAQVDSDTSAFIAELDAELDLVLKRSIKEIGRILQKAKDGLPHGQYMSWIASKGISETTAWRYRKIYAGEDVKSFKMKDLHVPELPEPEKAPFNRTEHGMGSSANTKHNTPQEIIQRALTVMGSFDVDPCSDSHDTPNIPASTLYTEEDDGLTQTWNGKVFLNPPYGKEISLWIKKCIAEYECGNVLEAILLLPASTDTDWYQSLYKYCKCFLDGRQKFGNAMNAAPFPSILVYMGDHEQDFIQAFYNKGDVVMPACRDDIYDPAYAAIDDALTELYNTAEE